MRIKVIKPKERVQKKLRAAAYARVSTDSAEQENSLRNQTEHYEALLGGNPQYEFVGVYSDQGISGYKEARPGFQKMMEDARAGRMDIIYVKSISRFARNTETVLKFSRELKAMGIGVYFELQSINTLSSEGELMMTILAAFAQAESETYSANAKMTIRRKFRNGEIPVKMASTYGFEPDGFGGVKIIDDEALVIRRIFDLALSGIIPADIRKHLNNRNILTREGKKWSDSTVRKVLLNVMYKGDIQLQKTYKDQNRRSVPNNGQVDSWYIAENHPAIVSPEEWDKVQRILQEKENPKSRRPKKAPVPVAYSTVGENGKYRLSGMLYCPFCGCTLHHRWFNHKRKECWCCSKNTKQSAAACRGIYVPAQIAEEWDVREATTVILDEDEYGNRAYRPVPKRNYERRKECPYRGRTE